MKYVGHGGKCGKVIGEVCLCIQGLTTLFTELSVYACNTFTHLKLSMHVHFLHRVANYSLKYGILTLNIQPGSLPFTGSEPF